MLDPELLRTDLDMVVKKLAKRGFKFDVQQYSDLEKQRKKLQTHTQELQTERNQQAKLIGKLKAQGEDVTKQLAISNQLKQQLEVATAELEILVEKINIFFYDLPNLPNDNVPLGNTEADNQEVKCWGEIKQFNFTIKDHVDLGVSNDWMDFAAATKLAGSRFVVLKASLARLHRALIQFMLDVHTQEHGYQEMYVPYITNANSLYATGQMPKFTEDQFLIKWHHDLYLIPTAEVPLTNLARDMIFEPQQLPLQLVAHTPCFRSEAGSYGKDTRGMIRQHQFEKVELVWVVPAEQSYATLNKLVSHAETILQRLELPYRIMNLCAGDLGVSAAQTFDLEVWLPAQQQYREISSCSNAESFQARRMQARWRNPDYKKPELLHTLNGSGLAVGRTLIAILENYQTEQGKIAIPKVLQPYMGNLQEI